MKNNSDHFMEQETRGASQFSQNVIKTLAMAYSPYFWRILAVLVSGLVGRFLLLGSSNIVGIWVDSYCKAPLHCRALPHFAQNFSALDYVQILSWMTGVGFLMTMAFRTFFSRLSALVVSEIYDEVTWRTSRFPIRFFDRTPAGRIITRFSSDYGNVFRLFGGPLAEFIAIVFDLSVMLLLMALASPYFLIFIGIIVVINYVVYRLNRNRLRISRRALSASRSPSLAHFAETTQGASTIRAFSKQDAFNSRFAQLDQYYLSQKLSTVKSILGFSFQMNSLSALLFLITGLGSMQLLERGLISLGSLGVAFGLIVLSGNTVQMFFEWLAQFEEAMIGVERLDEYLRKPLELGSYLPDKARFHTNQPRISTNSTAAFAAPWAAVAQASIEFKNVHFRYHDQQPWILKDINFKVNPGEKFGIIGTTGSGKSTLIQVLFHLYPLQQGEVLIEGKSLDLHNPQELGALDSMRSAISYISQNPTLFQGTLRDNLDMTRSMEDSKIRFALDKVGLKGMNLDESIEENGKNLSSGERQLVCMARCLLQKSPIVVLDEATSFVDPRSEEIMIQATRDYFKDRTQVIIAHRLTTLKDCQRILWLDQGKIRQLGPATEVLQSLQSQPQLVETFSDLASLSADGSCPKR